MVPLRPGKLAPFPGEPRFHKMRDSKVDIIAAQQDMVAHRHAPDLWDPTSTVLAQFEEAEISRAPTDIDHQHMKLPGVAILQLMPKFARRIVLFQPAVEGCLRLLDQPDAIRKARLLSGGDCQPLCGRVERGWNGNGDLLIIECEAGSGESIVPGSAKGVEDECGGAHRRDLLLP